MDKINKYVYDDISKLINEYKNIIYKEMIIGSFLIKEMDEGILLDEIYIEEEYRNMGITSSIINDLKINDDIYLWVYKENNVAIDLYKKLGFNIIEETNSRYYMELKNNRS